MNFESKDIENDNKMIKSISNENQAFRKHEKDIDEQILYQQLDLNPLQQYDKMLD